MLNNGPLGCGAGPRDFNQILGRSFNESLPLPVKLCSTNTILASSPFVEADGLIACYLPRKKDSTLDVLTTKSVPRKD